MLDLFRLRRFLRLDLDTARLHRFRDFAHEADPEKPVLEARAFHDDVVGERELPAEGPRRDALIDIIVLRLVALAALDGQEILGRGDGDLVGRKAREREGDLLGVLAAALDIVGRIALLAGPHRVVFHQVEQAVEADRGAPEGRKIKVGHCHILLGATWDGYPQIFLTTGRSPADCARRASGPQKIYERFFGLQDPRHCELR